MLPSAFTVKPGDPASTSLLRFLAVRLGLSNHKAKALLDARRIFVNGRRVWMARHRLNPGDRVAVQAAPEGGSVLSHRAILYRSADFLVADKPPGLLSNGPNSLESALRAMLEDKALTAVHRLDRDTSGCLLLARNAAAEAAIRPLFERRQIQKCYEAVVAGRVAERERVIEYPIDGLSARTRIRVLACGALASHLRIELETGRTHQIRRHLLAIGHPVIGEPLYAPRREVSARERAVPRHMLHAAELAFREPGSGRPVRVAAQRPADFQACLQRYGLL